MSNYQPVLYKASSAEANYAGQIAYAFATNLRADVIEPLLKRHGLIDIDPMAWYPQQQILNLLRDIELKFTFEELVAVGIKAGELAPPPPNLTTIEDILNAAHFIYAAASQNLAPGEGIQVKQLGQKHYELTFNIPSPPFSIYGTLYGFLRQVRKKGEDPRLVITKRDTPAVMEVKW